MTEDHCGKDRAMRSRVLMSQMAMIAAAATMFEPSLEYRPIYPQKIKRRRYRKPADRSRKQYLLKGIRP